MSDELTRALIDNGYDFHTRARGASGLCWHIGSKRTEWDYGEQQARKFLALARALGELREVSFRFSVTRTALATAAIRQMIGDPETFLREAGLSRFKKLLQDDDDVENSYPEVDLHSRSAPEDYLVQVEHDLDAEISRVRTEILRILRNNAYGGRKRTPKADIVGAMCTADAILDRTLTTLEHRGLIQGVLSGQVKITPEGEAEYEYSRAIIPGGVPVEHAQRLPITENRYDVFISHASEDKDAFVRPLAEALIQAGLRLWYDEFTLKLGDSLRMSIDRGLATSRYGVVILSHRFFAKEWPQKELNGLFALMQPGEKKLLPIWHEISGEELAKYSPMVADLLAARSNEGLEAVVRKILEVVKG